MKKARFLFSIFLFISLYSPAQTWKELGTGSDIIKGFGNGLYVVCSDTKGDIYAAGWQIDSNENNIVAKWDSASWTTLGLGSSVLNKFMDILTMIVDTSGNLYVGGEVPDAPAYIIKWDGTSWSKLGTDFVSAGGDVVTLCVDKYNNIYAAGDFNDTGGHTYVAMWDGTSWSELGTGVNSLKGNGCINTIFADTLGNMYAAGNFTDSATAWDGNVYVAKWDGASWNELGSGVSHEFSHGDGQIFSIVPDTAGNIYAAGFLDSTSSIENVMKWDGASWDTLGALNANNAILSLCSDASGNLYAAGDFTDTAGKYYVAKWDGASWSELGTGSNELNANNVISSICTDAGGNIFVDGNFTDTTKTIYIDTAYPALHPYYVAEYSISTTGIASLPTSGVVNVYPNPADNELNITGIQANTDYQLLSVTGIAVQQGILHHGNNKVSIQQYPPGIYILEMNGADRTWNIARIVKE